MTNRGVQIVIIKITQGRNIHYSELPVFLFVRSPTTIPSASTKDTHLALLPCYAMDGRGGASGQSFRKWEICKIVNFQTHPKDWYAVAPSCYGCDRVSKVFERNTFPYIRSHNLHTSQSVCPSNWRGSDGILVWHSPRRLTHSTWRIIICIDVSVWSTNRFNLK